MTSEELFDAKVRNRIVAAAFGLLVLATVVDAFDHLQKGWRAKALAAQQKVLNDLSPKGAVIADIGVAILDTVTPAKR
jgi:hypothetical protein